MIKAKLLFVTTVSICQSSRHNITTNKQHAVRRHCGSTVRPARIENK